MTPYLLDSDVLITAKWEHYRFSICPGFWDWVVQANSNARVYSIARVKDELLNGDAAFRTWVAARGSTFFLPASPDVVAQLPTVSTWATGQSFTPQAIADFFSAADYWLVAHALATGGTVVTHETSDPNSKRRVKLPDACNGVGVLWTNPFQMLEDEGAKFVL